ncbi:hypothetical protein BB560_004824 [Smittium megazygosporum]|uniref:Uncharacterized protein n=1 Tax=Smittium megazygosporum TaxID=133381 RepID=A0A2T9Z876_9FUNG|nr:hypothetical protein BB560_004824 [Smittium megazygosporum]
MKLKMVIYTASLETDPFLEKIFEFSLWRNQKIKHLETTTNNILYKATKYIKLESKNAFDQTTTLDTKISFKTEIHRSHYQWICEN